MKPPVHYLSLTCIQRCKEKLMMYKQFCESNMYQVGINGILH